MRALKVLRALREWGTEGQKARRAGRTRNAATNTAGALRKRKEKEAEMARLIADEGGTRNTTARPSIVSG